MKKISIVFVLFLVIVVQSCSGTKKDVKAENLEKGKNALSQGDYNIAVEYFNKVLAEDPHNGDALIGSSFGQFLASTVDVFDFVATMAGMNRSVGIPQGGFDIMAGSKTEKDDMLAVIYKILGGLIEKWENTDSTIDDALKYGNSLQIDKLPVFWGRKKVMDLGGDIDKTDLHTLQIMVKFLLGSVKFMLSQEPDVDIYKLYAHYLKMGKNGYSLGLPLISNLLVLALNDPELNFMGLSRLDLNQNGEPDGKEFYLASQTYFSDTIKAVFDTIDSGTKETDKQDDDVVKVYSSKNEKDQEFFDENNFQGIDYVIALEKRFYYNDTTQSVYLFLDSTGYDALERIKDQIDGKSSDRVSVSNDILPVLSDIISSLLTDLNNMGLIPSKYGTFVSFAKPSVLLPVLQSFIPDVAELDLNYFLTHPIAFRDIIPPWRFDKSDDTNGFFIEWEGSMSTPQSGEPGIIAFYPQVVTDPSNYYGIFTAYYDTLSDTGHFNSPVYRMPEYDSYNISAVTADTLTTKTPYFAFRNNDASFNKLLYINLENDEKKLEDNDFALYKYYNTSVKRDFQPATARDLNALIAYFYNMISSLLK